MDGGGPGVDSGRAPAPGWRASRSLARAVMLAGVLVIAGVVLGRVDVVLLATPFVVGTAWALRRRPEGGPSVEVTVAEPALSEAATASATVSTANPDRVDYDLVVVHSRVSPWLDLPEVARPQVVRLPAGQVADLVATGVATRWGRHPVGPASALALACDGLLVRPASSAPATQIRVYPVPDRFDAAEAMPRAAGLIGAHRSRQPGHGGELAGVRPFTPGDRLRRVDWRVSLRARHLHVAATMSDHDAEVVLVLDVLADAGRSGGVGGTASVLDTTVRAAAALGEHYLHRGDRVSLVEYSRAARRLRPASGRRQFLTVLEWLLDTSAGGSADAPYEQVFGPHLLGPDALIVVLTPLIDAGSAPMLARLARAGRFVMAVDTLPGGAADRWRGEPAFRLWRLERDNTVGALREHGVPVVAWRGAGSLDLVLRGMARAAAAPRIGAR